MLGPIMGRPLQGSAVAKTGASRHIEQTLTERPRMPRWVRWFVAIAAACAAMAAIAVVAPWLGQDLALLFTFPTVALVGLFLGAGPGIVACLVCAAWTLVPWLEPVLPDAALRASIFLPAAILVTLAASRFQFIDFAPDERSVRLVPRRDGAVWWLRLSMTLAAVLPLTFYGFAAVYSYERTFQEAQLKLSGTARVTQEHASKVFQTNEAIIGRVLDTLGFSDDDEIRGREADLHQHLRSMTVGIDHLGEIRVWGAGGDLLASSESYPVSRAMNIAERQLFRQHARPGENDQESQPKLGRITGEDALQFSQRRRRADDSFAGIVTLAVNPGYFSNFYEQSVRSEPGLALSLVREDGVLLARWPLPAVPGVTVSADALAVLASEDSSRFVTVESALDGVTRLEVLRKLPGYALYIEAGLARATVLAQWYRNLGVLAVFTFPTALALIVVSGVALRRARRERQAVEQLRAESDKRLHVEESLRQSQKLEAIGRMTGGVAHDVNNLLMVIDSNLHLVKKLEPALTDNPQLAAIARTAKTGERLMRQLLAFSRRQALNPEVIRLQDKLDSLVNLIRPTLGGKIRVDAHVDGDTAPVEVDTAELELAVLNLAVNARDAMPESGVLTIRGRNVGAGELPEMSGRFVELSVSDTGKGIAPEDLQYVLEPFFTTKGPGKGTGLGLSQVYGLCAQAGGTVRVDSAPGKGTTVRMIFEASDKFPAEVVHAQLPVAPLSARVLLVEDHHEVADATKRLLESMGCTVRHASTGEAAQAVLAENAAAYDVVLSDIAIPGQVNGIDLATWIRTTHPGLPVVLMTGYTAEMRRASELAHTVLQKPVSPQMLAATLAKSLPDTSKAPRRAGGTAHRPRADPTRE